jgi:hypothetical protein
MPIDEARARKLLRDFNFPALFVEELGWDKHKATLSIPTNERTFELSAVAEKRGMAAFVCECDGALPDYNVRRKIERQVAKSAHEHFVIFIDTAKTRQIWQWVKREPGKPAAAREHHLDHSQTGEALIQKLRNVAFELAEEENLTLVDVTIRARAGFDVEKVTKRFYERFQKEHGAFLKFIKGIPDDQLQRWYASVMLNRLMFIYFIQKKGFLNGDADYLRNKLEASKPRDRYFSHFLCPLFFEGFAKRAEDRSAATNELLGRIPYLNGGLFLRHQIEELHGKSIQVPDIAFERIFDFFEAYQWHLDERPLRDDNEINPDVLGYIFEKYINQKQMGAYYTKEDITEYISKNTVLPFLFDAARPKRKIAFENPNGPTIWDLLTSNPDRYIYPAVRHGVSWDIHANKPKGAKLETPRCLPTEIEAGIKNASKRGAWNKPAPDEIALRTEVWREVIARRQRYEDIRNKLAAGKVRDINELITLNLDIRQFAQDVIDNCEGPDFLMALWNVIQDLTVLDPTCGSGAFLFAALNILEPLYEACLDRMEAFLQEWGKVGKKLHPNYEKKFAELLARVATHPNRSYFVFKSIILNNLFGVDIMEEAVEICKLRLFLKLAAQVKPDPAKENFGIEPLPDIDFNIRAGNTLVGYATAEEVKRCMQEFGSGQMRLGVEDELKSYGRFVENVEIVNRAFKRFREMQSERGMDAKEFITAKETLRDRLKMVEDELNRYLASDYGVNSTQATTFTRWLRSHQPFHWFVEFYGIMSGGGFDVIIGNPPYVSAAKVRAAYKVKNLATLECPDIYAWMLERVNALLRVNGRSGMIVPLSVGFSGDFVAIRQLLYRENGLNWFSSFGRIPSALFSFDVRVRNTIHVGKKSAAEKANYTTRLHRWFDAARPDLFPTMSYAPFTPSLWNSRVPKLNTPNLSTEFEGLIRSLRITLKSQMAARRTPHKLYFKKTAYNWLNFCREKPPCYEGEKSVEHTQFGDVYFESSESRDLAMLICDGKFEFIFWAVAGDDFHVPNWSFEDFPIDLTKIDSATREQLKRFVPHLESAMNDALQFKLNAGRRVGNYNLARCRHITDRSDLVFARILGLDKAWDDVELYYTQVVKTSFDEPDT